MTFVVSNFCQLVSQVGMGTVGNLAIPFPIRIPLNDSGSLMALLKIRFNEAIFGYLLYLFFSSLLPNYEIISDLNSLQQI